MFGDEIQQTPQKFEPYAVNGGSIVAIAGEDFAVIGADTRFYSDYSILTRSQNRLFKLTDYAVLGTTGCGCDVDSFTRLVKARVNMYKYEQCKPITTPAAAQMISIMLYYKRFFPYFIYNILAGLDNNGKGCVFEYDPIGHYERVSYKATGTLLLPLLDSQIGFKNTPEGIQREVITLDKAVGLLKDSFITATERDINTGDFLRISIITKDKIVEEEMALRKD